MNDIRRIVRQVLSEMVQRTSRYKSFIAAKKHPGPNMYVHFTHTYKLGINPRKKHDDPHGIYFYPTSWIINENNWNQFQYGLTMEYFFLCEVDTSNFLNISTITQAKADSIMKKVGLLDMWQKYGPDFSKSPGNRFWEFLDMLNVSPAERDNERHRILPQVTWTKFWKATGYDGFSDTRGIVNEDEPSQICVFNQNKITVIESGENHQDSGAFDNFYKEVVDKFNIDVIKQGYINNGKEYRIFGNADGKAVDIRVIPSDNQVIVYYGDDSGRVYKAYSEPSFDDYRAYDSSMFTIKNSIKNASSATINSDIINKMEYSASVIFKKVKKNQFKSFGSYDKSPMIFSSINDSGYRDSLFRGSIRQGENGNLILDVDYELDKKMVTGDPIDVFTSVVDKYPGMGDDFYKKELAKRGVTYPDFKFANEDSIEAPHFKYSAYMVDPKESLKDLNTKFVEFLNSQNWAAANENSKLAKLRLSPKDKAENWFHENINKI